MPDTQKKGDILAGKKIRYIYALNQSNVQTPITFVFAHSQQLKKGEGLQSKPKGHEMRSALLDVQKVQIVRVRIFLSPSLECFEVSTLMVRTNAT